MEVRGFAREDDLVKAARKRKRPETAASAALERLVRVVNTHRIVIIKDGRFVKPEAPAAPERGSGFQS
jgi:hypothetical protein